MLPPTNNAGSKLTEQHYAVLNGMARGKTNHQIGKELGISEATVKYRVNILLAAFECEHRYNIVAHAYARGLMSKLTPEPRFISGLTGRQTQILGLLAAGLDSDGLADALDISMHTIKTLTTLLFRRLDANNRGHAVALGHQHRLLVNHWSAPSTLDLKEGWIAVREEYGPYLKWTPYPVPHPGASHPVRHISGL